MQKQGNRGIRKGTLKELIEYFVPLIIELLTFLSEMGVQSEY